MKALRIIFTVLCAACLLALFPVGTFLDFGYAAIVAVAAGVFFLAMLACKRAQEKKEQGERPPAPDFFHPQSEETKEE